MKKRIYLIVILGLLLVGMGHAMAVNETQEADSNLSKGMLYIGSLDYESAVPYLEISSRQGNVDAMVWLIRAFENLHRYQEAMTWCLKALEHGLVSPMTTIGLYYEHGLGVTQDLDKARVWYEKASKSGDPGGKYRLALFYDNYLGPEWNDEILVLLEQSAGMGNSMAPLLLGDKYYDGDDVQQSFQKALEWYLKAGESGNPSGFILAGMMYEEGEGVEQDYAKAFDLYQRSADMGDTTGLAYLASMYAQGYGTAKDVEKAKALLKQAIGMGSALAVEYLAVVEENERIDARMNDGQGNPGKRKLNPLSLKYTPGWHDGYPVIANLYGGKYYDIIDCFGIRRDNSQRFTPERPLMLFDVVKAINGFDTRNITDERLNALVMGSDTLSLTVSRDRLLDGNEYKVVIVQKNNKDVCGVYSYRTTPDMPSFFTYQRDEEIDFSVYKTYDFVITGDDPLLDKAILDKFVESGLLFSHMERDEHNPDLLVTISKNADESITSTYVPPTTDVIHTGSTIRPVYSTLTERTTYVTTNNYRYRTREGYTKETSNTDIYLEISILDAKKAMDTSCKYAPIVWQMIYNRHVVDRAFQIKDEYLSVATWNKYPFTKNLYAKSTLHVLGVEFSGDGTVMCVMPGSPADEIGFEVGDKLLSIDGKRKITLKTDYYVYYGYMTMKDKCPVSDITRHIDQCLQISGNLVRLMELDMETLDQKDKATLFSGYITPLGKDSKYKVLRQGKVVKLRGRLWERPFGPELYDCINF